MGHSLSIVECGGFAPQCQTPPRSYLRFPGPFDPASTRKPQVNDSILALPLFPFNFWSSTHGPGGLATVRHGVYGPQLIEVFSPSSYTRFIRSLHSLLWGFLSPQTRGGEKHPTLINLLTRHGSPNRYVRCFCCHDRQSLCMQPQRNLRVAPLDSGHN